MVYRYHAFISCDQRIPRRHDIQLHRQRESHIYRHTIQWPQHQLRPIFGPALPQVGAATITGTGWVWLGTSTGNDFLRPLYGFSNVLTVPQAAPPSRTKPSTLALLALGGGALGRLAALAEAHHRVALPKHDGRSGLPPRGGSGAPRGVFVCLVTLWRVRWPITRDRLRRAHCLHGMGEGGRITRWPAGDSRGVETPRFESEGSYRCQCRTPSRRPLSPLRPVGHGHGSRSASGKPWFRRGAPPAPPLPADPRPPAGPAVCGRAPGAQLGRRGQGSLSAPTRETRGSLLPASPRCLIGEAVLWRVAGDVPPVSAAVGAGSHFATVAVLRPAPVRDAGCTTPGTRPDRL